MADAAEFDEQLVQLAFALARGRGSFAMLLGSGLSSAAGIPTGWEITLDLIQRYARIGGVEAPEDDWASWYERNTGQGPTYSGVVARLAKTAVERRALLERYIEPSEDDRASGHKHPTRAHHAIAELVASGLVKVLITTNFDRLIENALRDRGIEPTIVSSPDTLAGAEPVGHGQCFLLKLHGDYKDARILNTEEELSTYPPSYDALLDRIFDEYGLIVVGWSGDWDHALRSALHRTSTRRYPVYWAHRGPLGTGASDLVQARRAVALSISDADAFLIDLGGKVRSALQPGRASPDSLKLLLSTTKRLLSGRETAIELDDLLEVETSRLIAACSAAELSPAGGWSLDEFAQRIAKYEAAAERLAKVAGLVGRWGGGQRFSLVTSVIRSLWGDAERIGSGQPTYLALRSYPALLVFTAYSLGLVRAGEWAVLNGLLNSELDRDHRKSVTMVPALFANGWIGGDINVWRLLPEMERRHTPLQDHLFEVFNTWSADFINLEPSPEMLFERFELLCSLARFGREDEDLMADQLTKNPHRPAVWIPYGRCVWDSRHSSKLLDELRAGPFREGLLLADFARSSSKMLDLFAQNFERITDSLRW